MTEQDKKTIIEEWLSEFGNPNTREQYKSKIKLYFEKSKTTLEDLQNLDVKEIKHSVLLYIAEQQKLNIPNNTILSIVCAVRSLCAQIDKPLKFRKGQLPSIEVDNDSHVFANGDLKLLFSVGDTFEKALLASAVSLGYEVSSFVDLDRETINQKIAHAKQNKENFAFFEDTRAKTKIQRYSVLNPLAIEWLEKYEATRKDPEEKRLFPITAQGINELLKRLAKDSGLKTTGEIRFHRIRSWLESQLSSTKSFNAFEIKYIIGHSLGVEAHYLKTLQAEIREKYPLVYNEFLNIAPEGVIIAEGKDTAKLIQALKQENEGLKKQIEGLNAQLQLTKKTVSEIGERLTYYEINGKRKPILDKFR